MGTCNRGLCHTTYLPTECPRPWVLGWVSGRYLVLSYFLPLAVLLVTYAAIWLLGLGGFDSEPVLKEVEATLGISNPILLMLANIGVTGNRRCSVCSHFRAGGRDWMAWIPGA